MKSQIVQLPLPPTVAIVISFTIPGQPKGKGRPRSCIVRGRVGTYTPQATRSEEAAIRWFAQKAMGDRPPLEKCALFVSLDAYFEIPASWSKRRRQMALDRAVRPTGKPDADNLLKMIDACNGVVWHDDAQIVDAHVRKFYSDKPRLEMVVTQETDRGK